jgi:hypothetical protein
MALLYKVFGLQPFGYHVVNTAVLALASVMFYLVLRQLGQDRLIALSVGLVFSLLPHYSSTRFWYAAFQGNLSLTLYFLSLYSDLRMLRANHSGRWIWKGLGCLSLLCSVLLYETALPLFLLNLLLVWRRGRQIEAAWRGEQRQDDANASIAPLKSTRLALLLGSNLVVLTLAVISKVLYSSAVHHPDVARHSLWFVRLLKNAFVVSYGTYGIKLPVVLWKIEHEYPDPSVALLAVVLGAGAFIVLRQGIAFGKVAEEASRQNASSGKVLLERKPMLCLIGIGILVFGLGYTIFVTNDNAIITATGVNNRINSAAAIGVALSFVGFIGLISTCCGKKWTRNLFCALTALLFASNVIINAVIASFWVTAYKQERTILQAIYQSFPRLPSGSIVLLDGVCPYCGPAIVFESSWDLAGALAIHYNDHSLRADVVTRRLKLESGGVSTFLYGRASQTHYPYGNNMFVYRFDYKMAYPIANAQAAHRYFETIRPGLDNRCPPGEPGSGSAIF